jgi:hypothetical protein
MAKGKEQAAFAEQRAAPRYDIALRSVLIECEIFGEHADILNIARLGFLARTRLKRATGTPLKLHLPDLGTLHADVVWCDRGLMGGRFRDPIDERSFHDFLARTEPQAHEI